MGRKKRKAADGPTEEVDGLAPVAPPPMDPRRAAMAAKVAVGDAEALPPPPVASAPAVVENLKEEGTNLGDVMDTENDGGKQSLKSGYAMTTHSAEIVDEDIYVSDGSDEDGVGGSPDEEEMEAALEQAKTGHGEAFIYRMSFNTLSKRTGCVENVCPIPVV